MTKLTMPLSTTWLKRFSLECARKTRRGADGALTAKPLANGLTQALPPGVSLVYDGVVVEDSCWLRPAKDSQHINLAELDAVIKGINLAILWKTTTLHLFIDSACVHKWISDTLTGKAWVRTKAASEMLIRRRLDTTIKLVKEYALSMNVSLVKSSQNKAYRLTRVPQRWLDAIKRNTGPVQPGSTVSVSSVGFDQMKIVHQQSGHPGMRRTLYFVKQIAPGVSKATVKTVVREYEESQSIDPAPVHWSKWAVNVKQTRHRVTMDITHCNGSHFLTAFDCCPARFAIWRRLPRQDATSVINQLKALFYERGPPTEILTDNDTAFRSSLLKTFLDEWRVRLRFRCAYVPSGNGIIEHVTELQKGSPPENNVLYQKQYTGTTSRQRMTYPLLQHQPMWSIGTAYGWKESMEHRRRHTINSRPFSNRVTECG